MIVTSSEELKEKLGGQKTAVALGFFDGVHIAHQKIIASVTALKKEGYAACVHTFSVPPKSVAKARAMKVLTPPGIKTALLEDLEVDAEIIDPFTQDVMRVSPEEFLKRVILEKLNAKAVAAGYDYRFGYRQSGDIHTLLEFGEKYNVRVLLIDQILLEGQVVSSTLIRRLVERGEINFANRCLGYAFTVEGAVQAGSKIGRRMALRTANLEPDPMWVIPKTGVYATRCTIGGETKKSVTNIGYNPTVGGKSLRLETHILDYTGDLYGQTIRVSFLGRLRDEMKFSSLEALKRQIESDISAAEKYHASQKAGQNL